MRRNMLWTLIAIVTCSCVMLSCSKDDDPVTETQQEKTPGTSTRGYALDPKVVEVRDVVGLKDILGGAIALTFKQMVVEYTSVGPDLKTPVRLTGAICMTPAVYDKTNKGRCLTLYNEFTTSKHRERTTQDEVDDVAFYVNKMQDQIVLAADLYGWTVTENKPQAYCCGEITATETLDFYDAAMQVLAEKGYDCKNLPLFNTGYSSGGYSAMAVQRFVDEKRPDVHFVMTAAGGAPFDINAVYKHQVQTNTTGYVCSLPLMVVAYKETYNLPFTYAEVFQKPLADNIQPWILSKDYGTWDINKLIGISTPVNKILTADACNFNTAVSKQLSDKFRENSLCGEGQNWQPNTKTEYFVFHSTKDTYMDWHVGEEMANYLKQKGCNVITDFQDTGDHVKNGLILFTLETLLHIERIVDPEANHIDEYLNGILYDASQEGANLDIDIDL